MLLHLFSHLMEIAIRLLNNVIHNEMVHVQLISIKIFNDPLGLSDAKSLWYRNNDEI